MNTRSRIPGDNYHEAIGRHCGKQAQVNDRVQGLKQLW